MVYIGRELIGIEYINKIQGKPHFYKVLTVHGNDLSLFSGKGISPTFTIDVRPSVEF